MVMLSMFCELLICANLIFHLIKVICLQNVKTRILLLGKRNLANHTFLIPCLAFFFCKYILLSRTKFYNFPEILDFRMIHFNFKCLDCLNFNS